MLFKTKFIPLAIALAFAGSAGAQEVIKIGHVAPVSGPSAHLGKDNENGAKMAVEELNAKGIKIGGKPVKFVLVLEDDGGDPKQGTAVAQKLVDAKVNGVIGHLNSGTTIPASKIYFDAGIPEISPATTQTKYTQQGFNSVFRVVANDAKLGGSLGSYAVGKMGVKKIAVIDDRTAYGQGVAEEFIKGAKKALPGVQIVGKEFTTDKATDFNAILTTIKGKNPDLIFFGGMDSVGGPLLRQMKALGIQAKYMGGDGLCTESLPKLAGADAVKVVTCAEAGGVPPELQKNMDDFHARYKKKYNMDVQLYAPYVYDSVMTMAAAMQAANSAEPAKYLPFLQKIKYQGVTGLIEFDAKGDIKDGSLTMYNYNNGTKTITSVIK
ncbi:MULTISPECIES: branched-chain amino acid ABC transporter substrate-binding protein [Duganella]|uniref:Branched-chain amino acid ABC transporter substrate-binding protein n=1 Tax=Duganella violaceipulchra TaxID=2849652 RepID=A0AA41L4V0_9BURK|nr:MULTISPECIES: branched-chain amino acid ABC transporter substrate-binding protein [Duganella]MBV6321432.1 branched-chain amino acid ABC transporter substrate-binding protein [Duganella violaceicalia]MCP2009319.1 branched-chain amino acid transport system substrate-binding protein [Duganella violaceicalia]RFP14965.1 branched-chain amino acid ABC transporter substrate-binding protein [Duganella sp. BJB475]RFP31315.1 branched-chain amino acid ABC transporter substrate-binding protein [Duganella